MLMVAIMTMALAMLTVPAAANDGLLVVEFKADQSSPAVQYAAAMVSSSERHYSLIKAALADLDGDGIGEIIVRREGDRYCMSKGYPRCRVQFLRDRDGQPELLLETFAEKVALRPGDGYQDIVLDGGREAYTWDVERGRYSIDLQQFDDVLVLESLDNPAHRQAWLAVLLRDTGYELRRGEVADVLVGARDLDGDGDAETFAQLLLERACTDAECPVRVYKDVNALPVVRTGGAASIGIDHREGMPDDIIVLEDLQSPTRWRFNAEAMKYVAN